MKSSTPEIIFDDYFKKGVLPKADLFSSLVDWADEFGERVALKDEFRQLSYRQLLEEASGFARLLSSRGLQRDDRVLVQLPNCVNFFIVLFAVIRVGALPVLVLPGHRSHEIRGVHKVADARFYIAQREHDHFSYESIATMLIGEGLDKNSVVFFDDLGFSRAIDEHEEDAFVPPAPDDIALLLLSGGTTNTPKLIPRTHADYVFNFTHMATECLLDTSSRYLCAVPVAHNFALGCPGVLGIMAMGGFAYLLARPDILVFSEIVSQERITVTALVPALAELLVEYMELGVEAFSSLTLIQVGAAKFSEASAQKIRSFLNCELQHIYGMAEGLLCFNRRFDPVSLKISTQGRPLSAVDLLRVVDEHGQDLPQGGVGELYVRGPYTIRGYFNNAEANREGFDSEGFYKTGDLVRLDEGGNVIVLGRVKEQINRAGEKYSPADTEGVLLAWDRIDACSVVGVERIAEGDRVIFFIQPRGQTLSREEVCRYLEVQGVAGYKYPDEVIMVSALPLTAVGKIDKKKLAAQYASMA
ncbi:AMP-binding protein [Pseudomonas sp. Z1-29]|uniref:(2,3-dihydroxybenzoyl)adenylate synthase n=1 Tax=unclassified Pseudomonas TaxID=196821 RepID=UPI003DA920E6